MPTSIEIDIELSSARSAHDSILESVHYVLREMEGAPCDGELRAKVLVWGNRFISRWATVTTSLSNLTARFKNYHRIHPSLMRATVEAEADHLIKAVTSAMVDLDFQRSLPPELPKINKAVSKIISGASDIYQAADNLVDFVKIDDMDPYNGMPYPHWEFNCDKCGQVALEITLIPPDAAHPLQSHKGKGLLFASCKSSEQEQKDLEESHFETVSKCLKRSDLIDLRKHSTSALIFCTRCKSIYCWEDWSSKTPIYSGDSMYSHTEGTCPQGHRQPVDESR